MKLLDGRELAGFIKERQAKQVRSLRQAHGIHPKLAIIVTVDNPVVDTYMRLKKFYGVDILVDVEEHRVDQGEVSQLIKKLNKDKTVHGIILQLPLNDPSETDKLVDLINPEKDVDGLGSKAVFDSATPTAILWLLAGYGVELIGKKIVLVGKGKLVGAPLEKILTKQEREVQTVDIETKDLKGITLLADIIVSATGSPGLLKPDMIKNGAVVVDAGTASEGGKIVGDIDPLAYDRDDLTITPQKGGVGPLTICALFDNTIRAAASYV